MSSEKTWLNQILLYHKDSIYNSNGVLELVLSTSTNDFKNFSALGFNISVITNLRGSYSLNFQNSVDLLNTLSSAKANVENIYNTLTNNEIVKKYHNDRNLKIEFKKIQNERVVVFSIIYTNTDYSRVIVPYYVYCSLYELLKSYVLNFINYNFSMTNRAIMSELLDRNIDLKNSIKTLPSLISETHMELENVKEIKEEELADINVSMKDFESFVDDNIDKIKIPEIDKAEEVKKTTSEVKSNFISKVLGNDLKTLENLLMAVSIEKNPIENIINTFSKSVDNPPWFSHLPNISNADLKSCVYTSKIIHDVNLKRHMEGVGISKTFPVLKYKATDVSNENIELAFDLLTISSYVKILRAKLENRENDLFRNKTVFHMNVRNFLDVFIFSFLEGQKPDVVKSAILNRFENFKNIGFFKEYDNLLDLYNLNPVSSSEMTEYIDAINSKVIGNTAFIEEYHSKSYLNNLFCIPYENDMELEQIINEVIPLEVMLKVGVPFEEAVQRLDSVSDKVKNIFSKPQKKREEKKKEDETNISRYLRSQTSNGDIPQKFKTSFFEHVKKLEFNNYDFTNEDFPIEELAENVVKALYEWNESSNKKETYSDFFSRCESSIMSKELIVVKVRGPKVESSTSTSSEVQDWVFDLD